MKTKTDHNLELFGRILQAMIIRDGIDTSLASYAAKENGWKIPEFDTSEELVEEAKRIMDAVLKEQPKTGVRQ